MSVWTRRASIAVATSAVAALVIPACGSPPLQNFYSLRGTTATATQAASSSPAFSVVVGPITLPALIDRPQWVVNAGTNQVRVLEQQRWAQPLADDIAQAVADNVNRSLGNVAAADTAWPVAPRVRLQIDVLRFESWYDAPASIRDEYRWAVSCTGRGGPAARSGISTRAETVATSDYAALAQAHAKALQQTSDEFVPVLREMSASCPGS